MGRSSRRNKTGLRRLGRAATAAARSSFVAWIAILALVVQLGSVSVLPAAAETGDAQAVAALGALKALLGPNVALCERDASAPGAPAHAPHHCCDDCALCQLAGHGAALIPSDPVGPVLFARATERLNAQRPSSIARPRLFASAQPRAPPISL